MHRPAQTLAAGAPTRVALSLVAVAAVLLAACGSPTASARARGRHPHTSLPAWLGGPTTTAPAAPRVTPGPVGMVSSAIVAENARPGSTAWRITGRPPGLIQGFASSTAAHDGAVVTLFVTTDAASFRVDAYRMGYYGGDGARLVWSSAPTPGTRQAACGFTPGINEVSCANWRPSLRVALTKAFVPGDYLFELVGSGGQESYVPFTVTDPGNHATYVVVARSLTEEGWNTYGGYTFYQGKGPCTLDHETYPPCNRARAVSFDRPYADGDGAEDFLSNEYPLVEYMEEHGLDVTYVTDVSVTQSPGSLLGHKAILSLGHDELWTYRERTGVVAAATAGENVAFMSAAAIVRHARLESSPIGADRVEVDYRNASEDPIAATGARMEVTGNTWEGPPTDWSPDPFLGEGYSGYLTPGAPPAPFVVHDASAWIFRGTGLHDGSQVPGVISSDIDHLMPGSTPSNLEVLGHSPVPLSEAYTNQGTWNGDTYSDMTYYAQPSGAGVFDSGAVSWISAMRPCGPESATCGAPDVRAVTGNLLWLFGQGPAGRVVPPVPNAAGVVPPGS